MGERTNTSIQNFATRDEFEAAIDEIARLQVQKKALEAARDTAVQNVLDKFNPDVIAAADKLTAIQTAVMPYAMTNAERLFGKSKSASCSLAVYGFKKGNSQLLNISGVSDELLAEKLFLDGRTDVVEVSYKLKKPQIKAALKDPTDALNNSFEIKTEERFFVEAKTDEIK